MRWSNANANGNSYVHANSNSNSNSNSYGDGYSDGNCYSYSNGHANSDGNSPPEGFTDAEAESNAAASPIVRNVFGGNSRDKLASSPPESEIGFSPWRAGALAKAARRKAAEDNARRARDEGYQAAKPR
jgi:hypothetical protein